MTQEWVKILNKLEQELEQVQKEEKFFNPDRWELDLLHIQSRLKYNYAITHDQAHLLYQHLQEALASNRRLRALPARWEEICEKQREVIAAQRGERTLLTRALNKSKQEEETP
jgi:hypothetical protein